MNGNASAFSLGSSDFGQIVAGGCYVDKTRFLRSIVLDGATSTLITRPRRFGKSLTLSTLKYFLEMNYADAGDTDTPQEAFRTLAVSQDSDFCRSYMGRFPVIAVSLRDIKGTNFDEALLRMASEVSREALRFSFLRDSPALAPELKAKILELFSLPQLARNLPPSSLVTQVGDSLRDLEHALSCHFSRKVVVLIDEYDVPLETARQHGFYREMIELIRVFLSNALKDNPDLQKAVLTGCLRISKESVFTGLNQFKSHGISDCYLSEAFGFTPEEVRKLLADFNLSEHAEGVRAHYDGYRFGNAEIYCPWDVMNFCSDALRTQNPDFRAYWMGSSGNSLITEFLEYAGEEHLRLLRHLEKGLAVRVQVDESLSFDDLSRNHSPQVLTSLLYMAGYLTDTDSRSGRPGDTLVLSESGRTLRIPNETVRECFQKKIAAYFTDQNTHFVSSGRSFAEALIAGDAAAAEAAVSDLLRVYVSVRDGSSEAFYHGFVLMLLIDVAQQRGVPLVQSLASNKESGKGYPDILFVNAQTHTGVILELKKAKSQTWPDLAAAAEQGLEQIREKEYARILQNTGLSTVRLFGLAFCGSSLCVRCESNAMPTPQKN